MVKQFESKGGFASALQELLAIDSILEDLQLIKASINNLRQEVIQNRRYLKDKIMNKEELIALIESKAQAQQDLTLVESSQVKAAIDGLKAEVSGLNATIEELKAQIEAGNDLTDVVAALESASGRVDAAIEGIYTPEVTPAPEPEIPPVSPVEEPVNPGDSVEGGLV